MLVEQNGKKYHITWQYLGEPAAITLCIISELLPDRTKKLLTSGDAICNMKDQFKKNTGRKLSLSRALLAEVPTIENPAPGQKQEWDMVFNRDTRKLVWKEYFRMHGKIE
jgi:hypothetical protein